ncbi:hypothetical protein LCGC14_2767950 [marine sediment metagenome]|uniref:Uncharacterized protein n=1 Tax=marine sediment metagenome TaxID=412755 RepID=A0A0F9BNN8_9ZZZZ
MSRRSRKKGIHGRLKYEAVKDWCAYKGMDVSKYTSAKEIYNFLIAQGLPKSQQGHPKAVISQLGTNLLERKGIKHYEGVRDKVTKR